MIRVPVKSWSMLSLAVVGVGLVGWGLVTSAQAEVIVDSNGFEPPEYAVGQLEGQEGWLHAGTGLSTALVQNATVFSGDQAVEVVRAPESNDRWAVPVAGFPTLPTVLIDWDMRVEHTVSDAFGPFFGVEAYDAVGPLGLLGSLGVDATTGDVLYQVEDTGFLTETGEVVSFGEWNHFQIALDYTADEYSVLFNGTLLATTGFVDRGLGLDNFTDADISAIAAAGDAVSQGLAGVAFYDNFVVRQIPEPQSLVLAGLGALLVGMVVRKKSCLFSGNG